MKSENTMKITNSFYPEKLLRTLLMVFAKNNFSNYMYCTVSESRRSSIEKENENSYKGSKQKIFAMVYDIPPYYNAVLSHI